MLNKVMLIGNLGKDPELRYTQSQQAVCDLRVATSESYTDRSGQKQKKTEWHKVVVWARQAENCNRYLKKGSKVYIEGKIQTRDWEDRNGNKQYTTEIIASSVQFLDARGGGGYDDSGRDDGPGYQDDRDRGYSNDRRAPQQSRGWSGSAGTSQDDAPLDDDLPF